MIAVRIAGTGSPGTKGYIILAGYAKPGTGYLLLDPKEARSSYLEQMIETGQPAWTNRSGAYCMAYSKWHSMIYPAILM